MSPRLGNIQSPVETAPTITSIGAVTLATHEMSCAVRFYRALGFAIRHGGEDAAFTSFHAGSGYLNLLAQPPSQKWSRWGRIIFYVSDVDAASTLGPVPRACAPKRPT
jgi:catechol-2,3-dioxygenase